MEIILNFLTENSYILDIVSFLFYVIISLLLYRRTNNKKILEEVLSKMKYRTEHYIDDTKNVSQGQAFSEEKEVYRLNKVTGELEKTDEKVNIQQLINSAVNVALDSVLERFLPQVDATDDNGVGDLTVMKDDLDLMLETSERAEFYREKYELSPTMSLSDIFKFVQTEAKAIQQKIFDATKVKEAVDFAKNVSDKKFEKELAETDKFIKEQKEFLENAQKNI